MKKGKGGEGFAVTKRPHMEKDMGKTMVADCKYSYSDNAAELKKSVDGLASYVKNNKVKR